MTTTRIRRCGESALLVDCADLAEAVGLAERIRRAATGAVDVVAAARTVLVTAGDASALPPLRREVERLLRNPLLRDPIGDPDPGSGSGGGGADVGSVAVGWTRADDLHGPERREVVLDVRYDGPDLADVAALAGVSIEAFVHWHTSITWVAAFGGFSPGFFYLVDSREVGVGADRAVSDTVGSHPATGAHTPTGPDALTGADMPAVPALPTVPRLPTPRPRVPAGSVAVADRFSAVYPGPSPGGWRLLGTTDAALWDVDRSGPALLAPGTRVRFREQGRGSRGQGRGRDGQGGDGQGGGRARS